MSAPRAEHHEVGKKRIFPQESIKHYSILLNYYHNSDNESSQYLMHFYVLELYPDQHVEIKDVAACVILIQIY